MIDVSQLLTPASLAPDLRRLWALSGEKVRALALRRDPPPGALVHTVQGRYQPRGWTEWTLGFQVGSALLQFDATGDEEFRSVGRRQVLEKMEPFLTHFGVHDHGFTCISTFGTLLRLMHEGRIPRAEWEQAYYALALKVSGAVQARRWTRLSDNEGYIYSFNGPHSLFADTIRSLRALALGPSTGRGSRRRAGPPGIPIGAPGSACTRDSEVHSLLWRGP